MRILHTADWHLGIDLHKLSLKEDQRFMLQQLYALIEREAVDVILICGDIYDSALSTKEAIQLFDEAMTQLCKVMKKQVIVIAGNHDSGERLSAMHQLLKEMGLHIFGKLEGVVEPLIIEDTAFYPVPFFHLETFKEAYQLPAESIEAAFVQITRKALCQHPDKKHVMLAHTFCANAQLSGSDRFAAVGGSDLVSAQAFEGFDYVALGHLHRMQRMKETVYYSGSPLAYSFAEAAYPKCALIYDTASNAVEQHSLQPLHPLQTMVGSFVQIQQQLITPCDPQSYYKIEMTDQSVTFEMMEYFQEHLPNLLQLTGKSASMDQTISIGLQDMEEMDDLSILKQFFHDYYDRELSEEEITWFLAANQQQEEAYAA